jgi:glycine dehydrogenase
MPHATFVDRHLGPDSGEVKSMLNAVQASDLNGLVAEVVPEAIRLKRPLELDAPLTEAEYLSHARQLAAQNVVARNFLGQGYYNTFTPSPILRNIFENPGWYTAYTPYQAEIAQGRMQAILNYQTMVMDLTGMDLANASLLDEGTAAAEAMAMVLGLRTREQVKAGAMKFFVSDTIYAQTYDVLVTRSQPLGIELVLGAAADFKPSPEYFGALLCYPDTWGSIGRYSELTKACAESSVKVVVTTDLLALTLLTPPGEWGADVVVGNSQRFGVPMGFGGPHAAFFACRKEYSRQIPGRIIGVTVDAQGKPALRMALQTREQHIRRDKATSNICTAQALLAIMAGMYAVYHGAEGLTAIAKETAAKAELLANAIQGLGYSVLGGPRFDTLAVVADNRTEAVVQRCREQAINVYQHDNGYLTISVDETSSIEDLNALIHVFSEVAEQAAPVFTLRSLESVQLSIPEDLRRRSDFLTHPVFKQHRSETELMRYIKSLERKDIALNFSMIALGSCTMKLNAASELMPLSWPEFQCIHPFAPAEQTQGYQTMIDKLATDLAEITGFDEVSLQPNSGAQGEYAGLMVIRAYHLSRGDHQRNIALIPSSAHGTNPASAVMAGMSVVVVACDEKGNIDMTDLRAKAEKHSHELACLMITYPSTHGVFEEGVIEITKIIHQHGGQVYMDGANMNAQVGLTSPANIGADVCHLNLHKTFAIPHGGGGPGMGPIGVKAHLAPFLPGHNERRVGGNQAIPAVSAAPWGSALILLISYGYIRMLGAEGLTRSTQIAILNANYMKAMLSAHYPVLYSAENGRVAHEFILDCRGFKKAGIEVVDIAKRLMDYGFHAPTVSFPVAGTLMIEPTESESMEEMQRFCDALIQIRQEIKEVEMGLADPHDNVLKHAPHTSSVATIDDWTRPYSRRKAVFPLRFVEENKFWPPASRVDDAHGDRNLVCACLPMEAYMEAE